MARVGLDKKLLSKIAVKLGKAPGDLGSIYVRVSRLARKYAISPEAALLVLANNLDVGASNFSRKLPPELKAEARDVLGAVPNQASMPKVDSEQQLAQKKTNPFNNVVSLMIQDEELRDQVKGLFSRRKKMDAVIREATTLLEHRIKQKWNEPTLRLVGANLTNNLIRGNPTISRLVLSRDPDEQAGFASLIRGVMLGFRNTTHHQITSKYSREEALRICALIDVLLRAIDGATIQHV